MRVRFDRLEYFLAVAESGGFSAAARRLGVSPGALSQAVRALERDHGVALFQRTTRRVALTGPGRELFDRLRPLSAEVGEALAHLEGHAGAPRGRLALTVPRAVAAVLVAPVLPRLRADWPALELEVSVSDLPVDLIREGFDAGIRLGDAVDGEMVAVPLTPPLAWTLVAAPAYVARHGLPAHPAELASHHAIAFRFPGSRQREAWVFERAGERVAIDPPAPVCVDDRELLLSAVRAGLGLALVDRLSVAAELADGRLHEALAGWITDTPGLSLYFPQRSRSQPKLRVLIEALREQAARAIAPR